MTKVEQLLGPGNGEIGKGYVVANKYEITILQEFASATR